MLDLKQVLPVYVSWYSKHMHHSKTKKILEHHHTGKVRHHRHTSYLSLALVLLLTCLPLFFASISVSAASATDPVSGSYAVSGTIAAPAPQTAPTITTLTSGHIYTTADTVLISGSCPSGTIVKVFTNEVLVGAAVCTNGRYEVLISLFLGNNSVLARAYNANDVASPDSTPISVQLVLPGYTFNSTDLLNTFGAPAGQFYLTGDLTHGGASVGQKMTWPLQAQGGQPPYALSISWGDGTTEVLNRGDAGAFEISHVYEKAGDYRVIIKAVDQQGNKSYLQLVAQVHGDAAVVGAIGKAKNGYDKSFVLRLAWQLLLAAIIIFLSFWLGERREKKILARYLPHAA
jgi:hypothetical protein